MRSWSPKNVARGRVFDAAGPGAGVEEQLVAVVMRRLRPALEAVFDDLQQQVETLVTAAVERELAQAPRLRRMGEVKHCSGCGLPGSRNLAGLDKGHTQEEHRRWQHQQRQARPAAGRRARGSTAAARAAPDREAGAAG
jgi:hypothetical protein